MIEPKLMRLLSPSKVLRMTPPHGQPVMAPKLTTLVPA